MRAAGTPLPPGRPPAPWPRAHWGRSRESVASRWGPEPPGWRGGRGWQARAEGRGGWAAAAPARVAYSRARASGRAARPPLSHAHRTAHPHPPPRFQCRPPARPRTALTRTPFSSARVDRERVSDICVGAAGRGTCVGCARVGGPGSVRAHAASTSTWGRAFGTLPGIAGVLAGRSSSQACLQYWLVAPPAPAAHCKQGAARAHGGLMAVRRSHAHPSPPHLCALCG
jgi:hypothetical protein